MKISTQLNPQQQEAATHVEGPMLVIAGAGSGKTRVVTERVIHLIELGILPSDILAVTFTNKAAQEMKARIQKHTSEQVLTTTFHSLGARILRESIHLLGYRNSFTIYDTEDTLKLLKNCLNSLGLKEDRGTVKTVRNMISTAKNDLISPEDIKSNTSSYHERLFSKIYPLYQAKLKEYNALDFDDLLFLTVTLLTKFKEAKKEYQKRWLFVLIDEYQDTNQAQYMLAKTLVAKHHNIFAVGDPDQSIYSWRGAQYQNILNFDKDFSNAKTIHLEHNYRSTNHILSAANSLIEENSLRYEKKLWSTLGEGDKIKVYFAQNEKLEAAFVVNTLSKLHLDKDIPWHEIVIFYRTNSQSRVFEDLLLEKNIPYVIFGGLSFYQRKEIKDLLAFLKLIVTDSDFVSFARTINIPKRGIGAATIGKFIYQAETTQTAIIPLCRQMLLNPTGFSIKLSAKQKSNLHSFVEMIEGLRKDKNLPINKLLEEVIEKTGYNQYLKQDPDSYEDRKENIKELITKAQEWHLTKDGTLTQFLEELTLLSSMEEKNNEGSSVHLMTIHNGKGLEFDSVFLVGLEEDLFPHINSKKDPEKLEEERRLCYVGMTRAKKNLYLTAAQYRHAWGTAKVMIPSRFFSEIPDKHIENLSPTGYVDEDNDDFYDDDNGFSFRAADRIVHKVFGIGTVLKVYNTSLGETYDVDFDEDHIMRSLVAKYAKLEKA